MICKDCIHEELCVYEDEATSECSDFKDKTQVAEVVRCKDCISYETDVEYYGGGTKNICRLFKRQMREDCYCSYGKKVE